MVAVRREGREHEQEDNEERVARGWGLAKKKKGAKEQEQEDDDEKKVAKGGCHDKLKSSKLKLHIFYHQSLN